jgi:hypothetical protein
MDDDVLETVKVLAARDRKPFGMLVLFVQPGEYRLWQQLAEMRMGLDQAENIGEVFLAFARVPVGLGPSLEFTAHCVFQRLILD